MTTFDAPLALASSSPFTVGDWLVLVVYFVGVSGLGLFFWRRNKSSDEFTAGGRSLPGWLCGLSIFATFLSSISYLALPGDAFANNWSAFAFSLSLPIAGFVAVRWFVPLYRGSGDVSAYAMFERRFGLWARLFASTFYLLFQVARCGVVMYLMALPLVVLFGWDIRTVIVVTGLIVTGYAFVGGIVAVIWADAIQAIVLLVGAVLAILIIVADVPGGFSGVTSIASEHDKFSMGGVSPFQIGESTLWVILAYGLFENLKNFGIDQSYIQRYIASNSDREAGRSVWLAVLLYVPVSALCLFIGSALFAYYEAHPAELQDVEQVVVEQKLMRQGNDAAETDPPEATPAEVGDRVFPYFIAHHLPPGLRGLLIAAIFAAAMSTVSTSLNSSATLVMSDFYERLMRPDAPDSAKLLVLRAATVVWGVLGTVTALALVQLTEGALDIWWTLSGVLGAAIVGLFLVGVTSPRLRGKRVVAIVIAGVAIITWMTLSIAPIWPASWSAIASPFHRRLIIVVGPTVMVLLGLVGAWIGRRKNGDAEQGGSRP